MKTKSACILKVEATGDFFRRDIRPRIRPRIRLKGRWPARHGFLPGRQVVIGQVAPGELRLPCHSKAGKPEVPEFAEAISDTPSAFTTR